MQITLIAVGRKAPAWIKEGFETYRKRIRSPFSFKLIEVEAVRRNKSISTQKLLALEAERIRSVLPHSARVIALAEQGKDFSTRDLADRIRGWMRQGQAVALLIGGADGIDRTLLKEAGETWSLSRLTLPHALARVLLAEQIYRACSILQNHPYHRE
ncbi:MAG: 23S rRNA (pseudouridine(1915)-N(3))-methyltransferase RlmH [Gammaproteobacteria bacterium RIFCSPLOWO2_02_FULL_56_15]|nr:MAG: 23S rRNA (pseudouridine(1915)-N(3))-methyltransferase RlmH [Gammaproteobacteria bacterium RIFCSPLOWO2_02_FULL_56_15]